MHKISRKKIIIFFTSNWNGSINPSSNSKSIKKHNIKKNRQHPIDCHRSTHQHYNRTTTHLVFNVGLHQREEASAVIRLSQPMSDEVLPIFSTPPSFFAPSIVGEAPRRRLAFRTRSRRRAPWWRVLCSINHDRSLVMWYRSLGAVGLHTLLRVSIVVSLPIDVLAGNVNAWKLRLLESVVDLLMVWRDLHVLKFACSVRSILFDYSCLN